MFLHFPALPARAIRTHLASIVAALALAGCSSVGSNELLTQSIAKGGPRKSVCVISAVGDTFSLQRVGITVFGNAVDKASIDAWGVDAAVASRIKSRLGDRLDVRPITYPKGTFASLDERKSIFSSDYKDPRLAAKEIVGGLVASQKCDLVAVVMKSESPFAGTNQTAHGLGILEHGSPIVDLTTLFALWHMTVYDGRTLTVLASKGAPRPEQQVPPFLMAPPFHGPYRRVDKSWLTTPGQVAQNTRLRDAIMELLSESLDVVVAELFAAP